MKTVGLALVALLLLLPAPAICEPGPEAGEAALEETGADADEEERDEEASEGADPAEPPEDDDEEEAEAAEEPAVDEDGEPLDEDDQVEVRGLVYRFFVEDDSEETQLGIEASDRDYLLRGGAAGALEKLLGKTVTAHGWVTTDEAGDHWLRVEEYHVEE